MRKYWIVLKNGQEIPQNTPLPTYTHHVHTPFEENDMSEIFLFAFMTTHGNAKKVSAKFQKRLLSHS